MGRQYIARHRRDVTGPDGWPLDYDPPSLAGLLYMVAAGMHRKGRHEHLMGVHPGERNDQPSFCFGTHCAGLVHPTKHRRKPRHLAMSVIHVVPAQG